MYPGKRILHLLVRVMTCRTLEQMAVAQQRAMTTYLPKRTVPPGKTLVDEVSDLLR